MRLGRLVVGLAVLLAASSASADTVLYQTSFDTDTTDVPGTYAPFRFDAQGYSVNPAITPSTPTDSTASVQSGVLHIARGLSGSGSSVPYAMPELTLSAPDLIGSSAFPSVFSISLDMGGTSGNSSWWSPEITLDSRVNPDIRYYFHPDYGGFNNFRIGVQGAGAYQNTSATGVVFPAANTLFPIEMTVTDLLDGSYQFDLSLTNPATSIVYTDSLVVSYSHPITSIGLVRQGHGGGDAIFDNLTISTSIPEPTTGLLLGLGLLGVAVRRRPMG